MPPPRPTLEQLAHYADAFNQSQTLQYFTMRLSFPDVDTVQVVLDPVLPAQRGGLGSDAVNGGVLAAMFDLALGCAPALIDPSKRSATVQLSINLMNAVRGDRVVARSKVTKAGEKLVFASAVICDAAGQECATATGISRLSTLPWSADGTPAVN